MEGASSPTVKSTKKDIKKKTANTDESSTKIADFSGLPVTEDSKIVKTSGDSVKKKSVKRKNNNDENNSMREIKFPKLASSEQSRLNISLENEVLAATQTILQDDSDSQDTTAANPTDCSVIPPIDDLRKPPVVEAKLESKHKKIIKPSSELESVALEITSAHQQPGMKLNQQFSITDSATQPQVPASSLSTKLFMNMLSTNKTFVSLSPTSEQKAGDVKPKQKQKQQSAKTPKKNIKTSTIQQQQQNSSFNLDQNQKHLQQLILQKQQQQQQLKSPSLEQKQKQLQQLIQQKHNLQQQKQQQQSFIIAPSSSTQSKQPGKITISSKQFANNITVNKVAKLSNQPSVAQSVKMPATSISVSNVQLLGNLSSSSLQNINQLIASQRLNQNKTSQGLAPQGLASLTKSAVNVSFAFPTPSSLVRGDSISSKVPKTKSMDSNVFAKVQSPITQLTQHFLPGAGKKVATSVSSVTAQPTILFSTTPVTKTFKVTSSVTGMKKTLSTTQALPQTLSLNQLMALARTPLVQQHQQQLQQRQQQLQQQKLQQPKRQPSVATIRNISSPQITPLASSNTPAPTLQALLHVVQKSPTLPKDGVTPQLFIQQNINTPSNLARVVRLPKTLLQQHIIKSNTSANLQAPVANLSVPRRGTVAPLKISLPRANLVAGAPIRMTLPVAVSSPRQTNVTQAPTLASNLLTTPSNATVISLPVSIATVKNNATTPASKIVLKKVTDNNK